MLNLVSDKSVETIYCRKHNVFKYSLRYIPDLSIYSEPLDISECLSETNSVHTTHTKLHRLEIQSLNHHVYCFLDFSEKLCVRLIYVLKVTCLTLPFLSYFIFRIFLKLSSKFCNFTKHILTWF